MVEIEFGMLWPKYRTAARCFRWNKLYYMETQVFKSGKRLMMCKDLKQVFVLMCINSGILFMFGLYDVQGLETSFYMM